MSNIVKIKQYDIANGKGIRTSIFFSGCEFKCKGCFNAEAWDFDNGEPVTKELYETKIKPTINEHIDGISILGGEPLHPKNLRAVLFLIVLFKHDFPNKSVWLWTGYTWEELAKSYSCTQEEYKKLSDEDFSRNILIRDILRKINVLVDGQYIEEQRDLTLKWRGSKNQRVINVRESLGRKEIVKYCK